MTLFNGGVFALGYSFLFVVASFDSFRCWLRSFQGGQFKGGGSWHRRKWLDS